MRLVKQIQKILSFLIIFILVSCSHVRLKYEAQVSTVDPKTREEKKSDYVYYKSYEVGGLNQFICGLTAVIWGGWCWSYLGYPTEQMKEDLKYAAEDDLFHKLGKHHFVEEMEVTRHGYYEDGDLSYFIMDGKEYKQLPFITTYQRFPASH